MGHYPLPIGGRAVAEAYIKNEIRDIVQALRPEDGIPAEIEVTVEKILPGSPDNNTIAIDVRVTWK